jgi:hypothetical protein
VSVSVSIAHESSGVGDGAPLCHLRPDQQRGLLPPIVSRGFVAGMFICDVLSSCVCMCACVCVCGHVYITCTYIST